MQNRHWVIGVDFGTDSARAVIVDARDGREAAHATALYPRWAEGRYQDPGRNLFRQHPLDYLDALTACVREALAQLDPPARREIAALSVDTTGSTPCPVDESGTPLALREEFAENPAAMFHLWKDHSATEEADEITEAFRHNADGIDYTVHQGPYSSEWFWAKALHTSRLHPEIRGAARSWAEHSDWLPSLLAGETSPRQMYRCACAAGHKGYWHSDWGGFPSERCLGAIDPCLVELRRSYETAPLPSTHALGRLTPQWAERLGLDVGVIVGGSSFDAHAGAVGAGVNEATMVLNLGTSAVDLFVAPGERFRNKDVSWAANAAEDSIIPGLTGLETGQASFGDLFAWLRRLALEPAEREIRASALLDFRQRDALISELREGFLPEMQRQAQALDIRNIPAALDWFNGRRYPYVNERAKGAIAGLGVGSSAAEVYFALAASAAFGQRRILDALAAAGIEAHQLRAVGGIAQKSEFLMQLLSDVLGKTIHVSKSVQACALGAAIYAAVAAGLHPDIQSAQRAMCEGTLRSYRPDPARSAACGEAYARYLRLAERMEPAQ